MLLSNLLTYGVLAAGLGLPGPTPVPLVARRSWARLRTDAPWLQLRSVAGDAFPPPPPPAARASLRRPRPTPPVFYGGDYNLAARVPAGLWYCPVPPDWVGANHGRSFYLVPPTACEPDQDYVLRPVAERLPRVDIFYGYNVAEYDYGDGDGDVRPPRTDAELARGGCRHPRALAGITLLGRPAVGCESERNGWVSITAYALYESEHELGTPIDPTRAELAVTLETPRRRLAADRPAFAALVGGMVACPYYWRGSVEVDLTRLSDFGLGGPALRTCADGSFW